MDSNVVEVIIILLIFPTLPIVIGLILILKAQALARSQLRFLTTGDAEPSGGAITRYRVIGGIFIAAPIIIFLIGILAAMNQRP